METEEKELEKTVEELKKEKYNQSHFLQVSLCILVDEHFYHKTFINKTF